MSTEDKTMLEPGPYIGAPQGHYQSALIVQHALELGWKPHDINRAEYWAAHYMEHGHIPDAHPDTTMDDPEIWNELVDEAEAYINDNHTPEGYWYGHGDSGDIGVWELDDE